MIIPIEAATDGYMGTGLNTLSIASNGYLISISIIDIIPKPAGGGLAIGASIKDKNRLQLKPIEEKTPDKKIIVVVQFKDKSYTKSKIVKNYPNLTVNDVNVTVNRDNVKPKIKIELIKKV